MSIFTLFTLENTNKSIGKGVVVAAILALSGCGGSTSSSAALCSGDQIAGLWAMLAGNAAAIWTFNSNGTGTDEVNTPFTWNIQGNQIAMHFSTVNGVSAEASANVDNSCRQISNGQFNVLVNGTSVGGGPLSGQKNVIVVTRGS